MAYCKPGYNGRLDLGPNDDPANFSIVDNLPMADVPVPTEEKSFGGLKAHVPLKF